MNFVEKSGIYPQMRLGGNETASGQRKVGFTLTT